MNVIGDSNDTVPRIERPREIVSQAPVPGEHGESIFEIYETLRRDANPRKYNGRDYAVDKHGNVYTAEMLSRQIY